MKNRPAPVVVPHQVSTEHHTLCPICGHMVYELDLEEVLARLEPEHEAPAKR